MTNPHLLFHVQQALNEIRYSRAYKLSRDHEAALEGVEASIVKIQASLKEAMEGEVRSGAKRI